MQDVHLPIRFSDKAMLHLRVLLIRVRKLLRLRVPLVLASLDLRKLRGLQGLVPVFPHACLSA